MRPFLPFLHIENIDDEKYVLTVQEFIAGWISGIGGLVTSHPADTVKVIYQDSNWTLKNSIRHIYDCCGLKGYYKGITVPAAMAGIQNSLFFGVYENIFRASRIYVKDPNKEMLRTIISGNAAGVVQVVFTTPVEVIKIQMQSKLGEEKHVLLKTVRRVMRLHGIQGFYHGFLPTALRDVPSGGLYLGIYRYTDKFFGHYVGEYMGHLISGGIAGALSYAPMIPFDVIKTRIQADNMMEPKYNGFTDCIRKTYRVGGFSSFFRGFVPSGIRAFVGNATIFIMYEFCIQAMA